MVGILQDRGTFQGIAATLMALALLAERAAGRSFPVRFFVLAVLGRAEAMARKLVAREIEADWPDAPCLDEPPVRHYGAADAQLLALRLRMLAAVLGALADADGCSEDGSVRSPAGPVPHPDGAASHAGPVLLLVFPAGRPRSCRSPPSWDQEAIRIAAPPLR